MHYCALQMITKVSLFIHSHYGFHLQLLCSLKHIPALIYLPFRKVLCGDQIRDNIIFLWIKKLVQALEPWIT
jgi:hypothetical protein